MKRFRKKPIVITAERWTGDNFDAIQAFVDSVGSPYPVDRVAALDGDGELSLWNQPEGQWIRCPVGHWVAKGVQGELYPIKDDILQATYEEID